MFRSSILINYVCMSVFCCCYFHFSLCSCLQYSPKGPLHWPLHRFNHLRKPKYKWKKNQRKKIQKRREILRTCFRIFRNPRQFLGIVGFARVVVVAVAVIAFFILVCTFLLSSSWSLLLLLHGCWCRRFLLGCRRRACSDTCSSLFIPLFSVGSFAFQLVSINTLFFHSLNVWLRYTQLKCIFKWLLHDAGSCKDPSTDFSIHVCVKCTSIQTSIKSLTNCLSFRCNKSDSDHKIKATTRTNQI